MGRRQVGLGVNWHLPARRGGFHARPFATTTVATSDLIGLLATDGHTVQSARDAIRYDPEGKAGQTALVDAGFGAEPLGRYVSAR